MICVALKVVSCLDLAVITPNSCTGGFIKHGIWQLNKNFHNLTGFNVIIEIQMSGFFLTKLKQFF